jgi:ABC-type transport system substrate-binding protein
MIRRAVLQAALLSMAAALPVAWGQAQGAPGGTPLKVFRYAFPAAESSFDPAQLSDLYSGTVAAGMFEAPLRYDYLARPFALKPLTAVALPEVSADFTRFTVRIRPGIYFADDPAFQGRRRELTAHDYVYSLKRHYDPRWKSPNLYLLENAGLLGLSELRRKAIEAKKPFPYDTEAEGLRALDRYTLQIRLAEPSPRFAQQVLADSAVFGAVAQEVVAFYGDRIAEHPVGTGPFLLAEWRRSSRIVLLRNPQYREAFYDETAPADDARSQAIAQAFKGRRLPMLDRVEIAIIEEPQPRWLSFLNRQIDLLERVPNEFVPLAVPNSQLAPNLARQGIQMDRAPLVDATLASLFNMADPVVGGYAPAKVALRRAISLAYNSEEEIRLVRKGQAVLAQTAIPPTAFGHNPALKTEMSDFDPARARALLDLYGYVDRNGDGWREQPDGLPLVLAYATQADQDSRQLSELWQKSMKAVGLRLVFKVGQWPENLKAVRAGKLAMWGVAWGASNPDGDTFLSLAYGPNKGQANMSGFDLPAFNALYIRQNKMPDGPERQKVMEEASKLMVAYVPYKISAHRIGVDLMHPWVLGYRRHPFVSEFWKFIDVDTTLQNKVQQ